MSLYQEPLAWDQSVIDRYDLSGPRYTSYPTAPQFRDDFSRQQWLEAVARSNRSGKPLSLYFHIPFCDTLCFYCACNKIVTHKRSRAMPYLERVDREMALQAEVFDTDRPVSQLHWGGGTPTYISEDEMTWLMDATRRHFQLLDNDEGEYSVEVHPGRMSVGKLVHMRQLGFNRVSMGVQDFNPEVQRAVNRYNSVEQVRELVDVARDQGYRSISMDLIYGLPLQTRASVKETLDQVIDLGPDRLSLFNYAHLPHLFKSQRLIHESDLPSPQDKLAILHEAIERLQSAGYVYIGMDHFAKPDDSLVKAQQEGRLQRNFQGYSTHAECDLIAFGVSAISYYGSTYIQNAKKVEEYQARIDEGRPALIKGVRLQPEDHLRRAVINQLICHFKLSFGQLYERFGINPNQYFRDELAQLAPMVEDGLIEVTPAGITVLNKGRLLIRRVCMVFDQYLDTGNQIRYSKVI
ncbi:oxygen-independent coproporphyrinogen III oxidase [Marinimicrobium koreense]|uniref:oxygen-independent coproporphyrinogen III oxidase n=1 Tax=Marinimicrobium koreense TaxID=306545 RepID=UPI003F729B7B